MIKAIESVKKEIDQLLIDQIEELLSAAKSGELVSLIFVDRYIDKRIGNGWAGTPTHRMIANLDEVKFKYFFELLVTEEG